MQALEGIRVLDLSRRYPGAYTTMFLGDFGADVIKVDPPVPAFQRLRDDQRFAAYFAPDRNKKSIIIDLKNLKGREVFYRLAQKADVLVECFRPGVTKRLGVDYATLKEINAQLIYCSLTAYGQNGPYVSMPGHDMNLCGISGALSLIGPRDGAPCLPSNFLGDMAGAGLHGAVGILVALMARYKTGKGQFVDIAQLDGIISLMVYQTINYFMNGKVPRRGETALTGGAPWAQVLRCKDNEYIAIGCAEIQFWSNLCKAINREDLIPLHTASGAKTDHVVAELAHLFEGKTRDEWFELLKDKEIPIGPVYYLNEAFSNPQVIHREMVIELDHPQLGKIRQTGIPIKLSENLGKIRHLGVATGSNTQEVMLELGYTIEEISELREVGAVV